MDPNPDIKFENKIVRVEEHAVPGLSFKITVIRTTDSVAGLLYDSQNDKVLLIKQSRVPMQTMGNETGNVTECVAGRFDVNIDATALFVKEAKEEAGVNITADHVRWLNGGKPMALSAGILTERCHLAFVEFAREELDEAEEGYGVVAEGEKINRVWMDARYFIDTFPHDCLRTWALANHLQTVLQRRKIARLENEVQNLNDEIERSFDDDSNDR